ncbi:MAG: DUF2065 domain-containing protein [Gammaproteobacteria bacterium]|nr:DUF2065 domain-containing protein [Gammaproteobacteria bacterium]
MVHELLIALGLVLVMEGIAPFLNPQALRRVLIVAAQLDDATLRFIGITSMLAGVGLLYLVN